MWTLKDQHVVRQFEDELNNLLEGDPNLISESVKDKWRHLKINLVKATEVSCGLSKNGKWRKQTWWWLVQLMMQWKKKGDWKIWKNSGSKEDYVLAKKVAKPRMFTAKKKAEKEKMKQHYERLLNVEFPWREELLIQYLNPLLLSLRDSGKIYL